MDDLVLAARLIYEDVEVVIEQQHLRSRRLGRHRCTRVRLSSNQPAFGRRAREVRRTWRSEVAVLPLTRLRHLTLAPLPDIALGQRA
jgi:hypothetical protein